MKVNPVSNQNFNGRFIYEPNLSINQLRNLRHALKDFDIYSKNHNFRIFNDYSLDKSCPSGRHFVCINAESEDKKYMLNTVLSPDEQKKSKIIKEKIETLSKDFEKKSNSIFVKIMNLFT